MTSLSPHRGLVALAPPLFVAAAIALSIVQRDELHALGWTALDHHGVPWPSALAVGAHGWFMCAAFACTGAALLFLAVALWRRLPRRRASTVAAAAVGLTGAGLLAAALPLDRPAGDPGELESWISSWHAGVHTAGFAIAGLAGVAAAAWHAAATRSRASAIVAVALVAALLLPGATGWYAFVALFLIWVEIVVVRLEG